MPTSSLLSRLREHQDRFLERGGGGRDIADVRVRELQDEEEVGGDDDGDDGHHRVGDHDPTPVIGLRRPADLILGLEGSADQPGKV